MRRVMIRTTVEDREVPVEGDGPFVMHATVGVFGEDGLYTITHAATGCAVRQGMTKAAAVRELRRIERAVAAQPDICWDDTTKKVTYLAMCDLFDKQPKVAAWKKWRAGQHAAAPKGWKAHPPAQAGPGAGEEGERG